MSVPGVGGFNDYFTYVDYVAFSVYHDIPVMPILYLQPTRSGRLHATKDEYNQPEEYSKQLNMQP